MKYYFRIKMLLVTFTLGLVGVWIFTDSFVCRMETNFPPQTEVQSAPVVTAPAETKDEKFSGGGASGGVTCDEARAEAKRKKKEFKHPNCE